MKITRRRLIVGVLLLLVVAGGGILVNNYSKELAYADSDSKAAAVDKTLVSANTGFAVRLLRELQSSQSGDNVFISPLSVSIALSMAYDGADTTTKEAMSATLDYDGMSDDAVNIGYKGLIESLMGADDSVSLNIGDSVWIRSSFAPSVKTTFTKTLTDYFRSEVYSKPFDSSTVGEVNSWVNKQTSGKITKILDQIDSDNVMFLINAIYFKGGWVDKFDASQTHAGDFTTSDGSTVKVDMMSRSGDYSYYADDEVQIPRLPYGRDKIAMYVFLPTEGTSLESYMSSLTGEKLEAYFTKMHENKLDLRLPKLKLEYGKVDLKDALTNMGMGVAFDGNSADFSGIADVAPQRLFIAFVDHKAVVEVNEEGTEAAAVTNVGISLTSAPMTTEFTVDKPYLFVIRDDRSGAILFSGFINDPTQQVSP